MFFNIRFWPKNSPTPHEDVIKGHCRDLSDLAKWRSNLAGMREIDPESDWRLETRGESGVWTPDAE